MKRRLSGTNLSSENHLPMFQLNAPVVIALLVTGAFSRNIGKLFSKLKLVTDNLLFIMKPAISGCEKFDSKNVVKFFLVYSLLGENEQTFICTTVRY